VEPVHKLADRLEQDDHKKPQSLQVNITIYDVPIDLVKAFNEKVVEPFYPGDRGISQAIRELMRKAVRETE
jgi:hypothetical protein